MRKIESSTLMPVIKKLLDSTTEIIFVKDLELRYIYASRPFLQMVGLERVDDLSEKSDFDIFEKADAALYREDDRRIIETGETLLGGIIQIPNSEPARYTTANKSLLVDDNGIPIGIIGIGKEISETLSIDEREKMLNGADEDYRIAIEQNKIMTARFDLQTRIISRSKIASELFSLEEDGGFTPQMLIDIGLVHPDYVEIFNGFFDQMCSGKPNGSVRVCLLRGDGTYRWFQADYSLVYSDSETPAYGVISFEDVTERREKELAYERWRQMECSQPTEKTLVIECNLTRNIVESTRGRLPFINSGLVGSSYDEISENWTRTNVHIDDRQEYTAYMNREGLLADFGSGFDRQPLEFRAYTDPNNRFRWTRMSVQLIRYPDSNDIKMYITYTDIDKEKLAELELREKSELDSLTGALNRSSFISKCRDILGRGDNAKHAFLMIDIDNFKEVNDTLGHIAGDTFLSEIVASIKARLRNNDLIGRMGGDEFMIMILNIPDVKLATKRAKSFLHIIDNELTVGVRSTASIGISVFPRDGADFDTLYAAADSALYRAKSLGKNRFTLYDKAFGIRDSHSIHIPADPALPGSVRRSCEDVSLCSVENGGTLVITKGEKLVVSHASDSFFRFIGLSQDAFSERYSSDFRALIHANDIDAFDRELELAAARRDEHFDILFRIVAADRKRKYCYLHASLTQKNEQTTLAGVVFDITDKMLPFSYLRRKCKALMTAIRSCGFSVISYNIADAEMTAYMVGGIVGKDISYTNVPDCLSQSSLIAPDCLDDFLDFFRRIRAGEPEGSFYGRFRKDSRDEFGNYAVHFTLIRDNGGVPAQAVIIFEAAAHPNVADAQLHSADSRRYQDELRRLAERDSLTGLLNRDAFLQQARRMIKRAPPSTYTMSIIDIDRFKAINDTLGHDEGDRLLTYIGCFIRNHMDRVGGICCRDSNDHFAILEPNDPETIRGIARAFEVALRNFDVPFDISTCTGRCIVDNPDLPITQIFDHACLAHDTAKKSHVDKDIYYNDNMRIRMMREQEYTANMKSAIANGEFTIYIQPQYNQFNGNLIGAEALVRWIHPQRGLISPGEFIPVFEKNGIIVHLDRFVWDAVCKLLRRQIDSGVEPVPISVNVSQYDLRELSIVESFLALTKKYDLDHRLLRIEITETAYTADPEKLIVIVRELQRYGFLVEMDDFGSGYSSLNFLKEVPVDVIKLDMRFFSGIDISKRGGSIISSVVRMMKMLGLPVIAEGVETTAQADFLKSIGCRYIQGFLFGMPMPVEDFLGIVKSKKSEEPVQPLRREMINVNDILSLDSAESKFFNYFINGMAIVEYQDGRCECLRANQQFWIDLRLSAEQPEVSCDNPLSIFHPDDCVILGNALNETAKVGTDCSINVRRLVNGNDTMRIHITAKRMAESRGRALICLSTVNLNDIDDCRTSL